MAMSDKETALKEPMACGHPKACIEQINPTDAAENHVPPIYHCTACEQVRLERAAALRAYGHHKNKCAGFPAISEEQLARDCDCGFVQAADRSALDALKAEVRDRALEEAAQGFEKLHWKLKTNEEAAACCRALRGSHDPE